MKYIVGILIVIVIIHDVNITRLNRKVSVMQSFIDAVVMRLEKYASEHGYKKEGE